jgi:hypothetical protein
MKPRVELGAQYPWCFAACCPTSSGSMWDNCRNTLVPEVYFLLPKAALLILTWRFRQSSLDPVFRADLCIVEISILCLLRCRKSGGNVNPGGIKLRVHIFIWLYANLFWIWLDAKYTNISRRNLVSMALFLCDNIHQGHELFSVHSGGKQCAFMSWVYGASYSPKYSHCPHGRLEHLMSYKYKETRCT